MPGTFMDIAPKILSTALKTLRENAVFPKLVNSDYATEAAQRGTVINVPVPTKLQAVDVIPGKVSQNTPNMQLDTVQIPMNFWKESSFELSDKENLEIMDGVVNMQVQEAAKAIANSIDMSLINLYQGAYSMVGTPGTTPFGSTAAEAIQARNVLNKNLAPLSDRRIVLTPDAESNAISLPAFQYYLNSGSTQTMAEGELGRKFGFDWYMDQNLTSHTAGTLAGVVVTSGVPTSVAQADSNNPALRNPRTINTVGVSGATNGTTIKVGDVFTVAGDTQTYVITNNATVAGGIANISFSPAPRVIWNAGSTLTLRASRALNLAFHRDAMALAVRPLAENSMAKELGARSLTMVDPVTGIPLRLQVRFEFNQVRYAVDALWGVGLVRPEHIVAIAG